MRKDEHIRKAFGKRLRKLREAKDWTQTDLAYETDVEPGYISKMELGKANPSLMVIIDLARALGCKSSVLIDDL